MFFRKGDKRSVDAVSAKVLSVKLDRTVVFEWHLYFAYTPLSYHLAIGE